MTDKPYTWWYVLGAQPERCEGPYESREGAAEEGEEAARDAGYDSFTVMEARHEDLRDDAFRAERLIEQWEDHNADVLDPDRVGIEANAEQRRELEEAVAAAFAAWRAKHNLRRPWALDIRQSDVIAVKAEGVTA